MGDKGQEARGVVKFKKRSRVSSSRKRPRTVSESYDVADQQALQAVVNSEGQKKKTREWEREHYSVNGKMPDMTNIATAVREDVGGETNTTNKKKKPFGPMQAPAHIRTSVRVDYQADICKDYKETGYCGFGDSCKFLHDRSDYKAGWQLERDWAEKEKSRREKLLRGEDLGDDSVLEKEAQNDVDTDGLPFACYICRNEFKQPVVTVCNHFFCELCALRRMKTDSTCAICKKQLSGTLNVASKLVAKLKTKKQQSTMAREV